MCIILPDNPSCVTSVTAAGGYRPPQLLLCRSWWPCLNCVLITMP